MKLLSLILATIVISSCALIAIASSMSLSSARSWLDDTQQAAAYSCAYIAGQYDIMDRMPAIFPGGKKLPEETVKNCAKFKENARKHGFTIG